MELKKLDRKRNGFLVEKPKYIEVPEVKKASSAKKKIKITTEILDEDDQLNLLAANVEEMGEFLKTLGFQSELFEYSKIKFAEIRAVLEK